MKLNPRKDAYRCKNDAITKAYIKEALVRNQKIDTLKIKGATTIIGSFIGNALLPGIGLIAGPILTIKTANYIDKLTDNAYRPAINKLNEVETKTINKQARKAKRIVYP